MNIVVVILGIVLVLLFLVIGTRKKKAAMYKIHSTKGIQEETYVSLGGIRQFIQIRGEDKENLAVLFLHGGPGGYTGIGSVCKKEVFL